MILLTTCIRCWEPGPTGWVPHQTSKELSYLGSWRHEPTRLEWPSTSIKPNWPSPAQHNLFIDILANHGMSQIVDQWTRGENTLDLIAVNYLTFASRTEILPGISDHDAVFAEIDIRPKRYGQAKRKIPPYKKADWEGIVSQIITTNQYI